MWYNNFRACLHWCLDGAIGKGTARQARGRGSILAFSFHFIFAHAQWFHGHPYLCCMTSLSLSHMCFDVQINNFEFESQVCYAWRSYTCGPDSILAERVLAGLGPHGSWSFSPVGGNCLHSEGELAYVLSEKGKEDCQISQRVLVVNLKGIDLLDPWWLSGNPLWGAPFSLGQNLREG